MENEKLTLLTETVGKYLRENGYEKEITPEGLVSDRELLDEVIDAVIALICKIGIDENFAPNQHGIILDGCLEMLNSIREENK